MEEFAGSIHESAKLNHICHYQEKYAYELTENMPAGSYVLTLTPRSAGGVDLAFRFVSTRFLELFGLEREALIQDPNLPIQSIHPEDRDSMNCANACAYADCKPFRWEGRTLINGQTRWLNISSNPRVTLDGTTIWEGVVSDITSHVEAQRMLQEALENEKRLRAQADALRHEAERAHRIKSIFLADMSHEIRTPLSALVSLSQIMWIRGQQKETDPEYNRFLNRVRCGSQYLNLLFRNMLDISSAESGRVPVKASEFYLADWLGEIQNILDSIADYRGCSIQWIIPEKDEARWCTDEMRLSLIALNLGDYALKFNEDRCDPIWISVAISGDQLVLAAKQVGSEIRSGMVHEVACDRAIGESKPWLTNEIICPGLAVAIFNSELLGGTLHAEPLPDKGTVFSVKIPKMR